jgi:hypothetical protein
VNNGTDEAVPHTREEASSDGDEMDHASRHEVEVVHDLVGLGG